MSSFFGKAFWGIIIFIIALILIGLIGKYFFASDSMPKQLKQLVEQQINPFTTSKDSTALCWKRAELFLTNRKNLYSGGEIEVTDSVIYMPVVGKNSSGSFIKVERKLLQNDSTLIKVEWMFIGNKKSFSEKELILFMRQGVEKFSYKQ